MSCGTYHQQVEVLCFQHVTFSSFPHKRLLKEIKMMHTTEAFTSDFLEVLEYSLQDFKEVG